MKLAMWVAGSAAVVLAAAGLVAPAIGQGEKGGTEQPDQDEMMKAWEQAAAPDEHHREMARLAGEWDASVKMWMDPAAPPMESKGRAVNRVIFGGRYIEGEFTGEMMGAPFEGKMTWAYNKLSGKYESTWIDNMGTGIAFSEDGTYDAAAKAWTSTISMWDPMMGKMSMREVVTLVDDDTHRMEMYATAPDGGEVKAMEIVYKRKGAKPGAR